MACTYFFNPKYVAINQASEPIYYIYEGKKITLGCIKNIYTHAMFVASVFWALNEGDEHTEGELI